MTKRSKNKGRPEGERKTYLIRRQICRGMICTFAAGLLLLSGLSVAWCVAFLDRVLDMAIRDVFFADTYSIAKDIMEVKANDFMLSQNELRISQRLIVDLIERRHFNSRSLGDPNTGDLSRFKEYCGSGFKF